jgi:glutamate N-acetyltransferase/amino-acid N-acetyltransferase
MTEQIPLGFTFAGVAAGIKKTGAGDLALIVSDRPCSAAATFTTNAFPAAPVLYDRALVQENPSGLRAVAINAGCANACTGEAGLADAAEMAHLVEAALGLPSRSAAVMSTGVIGPRLPMDRIAAGVGQAAGELAPDGWDAASRAIMTTDTRPKTAFRQAGEVRLFGMCKGAGMIHPNMATMLAAVVTDAAVEPALLTVLLHQAVEVSFNCISVDGDMSTNDTVLLLANGASDLTARSAGVEAGSWKLETGGSQPSASASTSTFASALTSLCTDLAQQIVRDGEGATKFITVRVEGAASDADARLAAKAVANSPLVKTAFYGGDANWGRILAAVGYSGARIEPTQANLWIAAGTGDETTETARGLPLGRRHGDALQLVQAGQPLSYSEEKASAIFAGPEISVTVDLGLNEGQATVWTCDLSHDYVSINGHYRT